MPDKSAGNNRGQSAGVDRFVKFSRSSAQRIAKVVRAVESGDRNQPGLTFDHPLPSNAKTFRICTYTGVWGVGQTKAVELVYVTTTPNTVSAQNIFFPLPDVGTVPHYCAIQRDAGLWFLTQVRWTAADLVSSVNLTTAALQFSRFRSVHLGEPSTITVSITTCATSTTS